MLLKAGIRMNIYKNTKKIILDVLYKNFQNLNENIESKVTCEQPKNEKFGDISTNVIMVVSKTLNIEKTKLSDILIKDILRNKIFEKVNFVEPGFLNINFTDIFWLDFLKTIYLQKENYGCLIYYNSRICILSYYQYRNSLWYSWQLFWNRRCPPIN